MINKTGYPIFTPNQVLTKDDLNDVVSYLDGLNRLTRTHLIGMGIVCGLEVQTLEKKAGIYITSGCGITSEGFCIQYSPITDQKQGEVKNTFTHYRDQVPLAKNLFIKSESSEENYFVRELITPEEAEKKPQGIQPLTAIQDNELYSQVLVILYDWEDLARQDYCQFSYDDRGQERSFRLRFLLLPSSQNPNSSQNVISAERLLSQGYQVDQLPEPWKKFATQNITQEIFETRNRFLQEFDLEAKQFKDFAPQIQRFGCVEADNSVDLTSINNYKAFREKYYLICENAIAAIDKAFPKLFCLFSPFFTAFQPNSVDDFSQIKENLTNIFQGIKQENLLENIKVKEINPDIQTLKSEQLQSTYALQYFYDYLSLLVAAYYELAEATFDLMDDCTPDTQRFPRFLMLGLVPSPSQATEVYAAPSVYRSYFTQPPIYNGNQLRINQVRYLYQRLLKFCGKESFCLLPFYNTPLKITPSKDQSTPLSEQAIPYYLHYPNLYKYWNYNAYRKGRSDRHPAYFYPKSESGDDSHDFNDLIYRLDVYNFYRIEGHIGKTNDDVLKRIQDYKQRYNLAFDVITLKLGSQASLQDLNISGQSDDLEADFRRVKGAFQKLWTQHQSEWSKNVLLQTLKQSFFDKPGLRVINSTQLFNPILDRARQVEAYEFVRGDTDQQFKLYLRDANNIRIAHYVIQKSNTEGNSLSDFEDFIITLAELSSDALGRQQEIIKDIVNLLSLSQVTYELLIDLPSNPDNYYLKLSTPDKPLSLPQYSLILLSETHFSVNVDREDQPIIDQPEFPDFETLYHLLRDIPTKFNTDRYQIGNPQIAEELNYFEFMGLIKAYRDRLEQLMKLHLFNKFAQQHPGMEHLGGVPKGGTFVLVYVDGQDANEVLTVDKDRDGYDIATLRTKAIQEAAFLPPSVPGELPVKEIISNWEKLLSELQKRKDIVIADFCLPYRCSSNASAVSYVIARSRPIIILEKTVFCEDDDHKYEFTLEPEGGTVRGKGIVFEGSKQFFQPSSIDKASRDDLAKGLEVAITFAYAVDETYDTLTVTVYPLPKAELSVSDGQNFCHDAEHVEIKLADGTSENIELVEVKINDIETTTLNFSEYATASESQTVTIKAKIRNLQTKCENTLIRTITINPLPEAELSILDGQNFCHDAEHVEIKLAEGTSENIKLVQVKINDIEIKTKILNPSEYATGSEPQTVTIKAKIRNLQTMCENTLIRIITINPLPEAELSILDGQNFCHDAEHVEIKLAEGTSENIKLVQVKINDIEIKTKILNPSEYATGSEPQTVTIKAKIRNLQTMCENTLIRIITINPLPEAELSILDGQNFCHDAEHLEIKLAEGTSENIQLVEVKINDIEIKTKILNPSEYATASEPQTVTIKAKIRNFQTMCENTLIRTVIINPLPKAELSIFEGQNFCHNSSPVEINLVDETSGNIQLVEVKINDIEIKTKILNPSEYATASEPQTVTIKAKIRNFQTMCENTLIRTVIINPLPKAELSIFEGQNFCHNSSPVEINLVDETSGNIQLVEVKINDIEIKTKILNPSKYATASEPQTVTIKAKIRNFQTMCENTLIRTVIINPLPKAELSIFEGQNFCHNSSPVEINLVDETSGNIQLVEVKINDIEIKTKILNPSEYATASEPQTVTIKAKIRNLQTMCENTLIRTITINPLPKADFKAEITDIQTNGFSVRVFNIQPDAEPSFTFVWEHDGISNISNPGNNEFIIRYNYDFNTWVANAEKSITLRVKTPPNLGSCTSEPVTKRIAVPLGGVQGFNLLTTSNDETYTTALSSDDSDGLRLNTFNRSEFDLKNNEYAIACVTIPATVGSVVFTYTAPNASSEVNLPVNAKPYHLPNWQPIVGTHRITAKTFREVNGDRLEGTTSTVIIQINDDNNGEPELIPNEPEPIPNQPEPIPNQPEPRSFTLPNRLRVLFEPRNPDIGEFKLINHEDTIKATQVLVLEQPHLDKWRQRETTRDKNLIFSALTKQSYLGKLLVISAASLLLVAGWTYTIARQSQNQQNSQPSSNLRF
ncbi:hypothetical protein [Calothrix sp. PCC 6303]|uniref:hypothetical protein n=1 Tax=Calothrix sp. PCC 6303 TaxID=1170562 RepID=UPI0002FC8AE1|nr:hypothetical protein [Calothrix sp. PCC 6303]